MKSRRSRYSGYRFPPEIISYAVWAYHRFCLSFRDVEDLLAERGIIVSYETIRRWCQKFGPDYARKLKRREGRLGDHWHLDEVFIRINGQQQYLWRAVDQDGDVIDILVQPHRDQRAAERFFRRLLRGQGSEPLRITTDKLRSYSAAIRTIFPNVTHSVERYANNRAEVSHQPTRQRERQMRRFKSVRHAQRFLSLHDTVRRTCHVESNNFTVDPEFIAALPANDPLFVAEFNPALATLERSGLLRSHGLILVNADGFDSARGFTLRSVQNVQALANSSVRPDASFVADFSSNGHNPDPSERLGWGNDGAPLRDFAIVAIAQHAPKSLARVPGVDFRVPTDEELDALVAYQLPLGRQEDFNLPLLQLTSSLASTGKSLYLDTGNLGEPGRKNCNACHFNAGGTGGFALNPQKPGFPRLDASPHGGNIAAPTNVNDIPEALVLGLPRDGGFGQIFLPLFGSFGNDDDLVPFGHLQAEEFNSGPLVEAADTGPFFHNHTVKTLEEALAFYGTQAFQNGLFSKFGLITVSISSNPNDPEVQAIAAFLRVLNALENIRSSINVAQRGQQMSNLEDARELARLALAETGDAVQVLSQGALAKSTEPPILTARAFLLQARALLEAARLPAGSAVTNMLDQAIRSLRASRAPLANPATLPLSFRN